MPKGFARFSNAKFKAIFVAAHITVSSEKTYFKAASRRPVTANVTINFEHITAADDFIAIQAKGILATPAADIKAGPSKFAPT